MKGKNRKKKNIVVREVDYERMMGLERNEYERLEEIEEEMMEEIEREKVVKEKRINEKVVKMG